MKIDARTRAMIDEALAKGRARVVPSNVSGVKPAASEAPMIRKRGRAPTGDKAAEPKKRAANAARKAIADRRRFKFASVPTGEPAKLIAAEEAGTIFPTRVFQPTTAEPLLKDGSSNSKIGGDVLVGWLRGARIYTLTLEERATCPRSCLMWRGCYGNAMQFARRWAHGPALEAQLRAEVKALCATQSKVLIRLHVLGDFYSADYVKLWVDLLQRHAGLYIFGFTAWRPNTPIGGAIARLRAARPDRFFMRHSGSTGPWGSFTLDFPTEKARIGDAVVCPEQRDGFAGGKRGMHCGACGLCWKGDTPIAFVEH